ncbi:outer envelope membrane protein 7 [Solanum lycopersicum]|uniref:outer envelope membrane protein 7 n=1 Tax=Solanum lycopersicum TaxID=4081 RepID=UPI000276884E|nr:uncharacterized protein LOC104645894 [Solanum lycopersicum]
MGALTTALIAIGGVVLGWITIEMACKPCLEKGREAIDQNLNPDYDPDDQHSIREPLTANATQDTDPDSASSTAVKIV